MDLGVVGGIIGSMLGLAGGFVGTYFSIRNTNGPRERSFVIKCAAICFTAILLFLMILFILPHPYRWFIWTLYWILLSLGIIYGNKAQQKIREQEAQKNVVDSK